MCNLELQIRLNRQLRFYIVSHVAVAVGTAQIIRAGEPLRRASNRWSRL